MQHNIYNISQYTTTQYITEYDDTTHHKMT